MSEQVEEKAVALLRAVPEVAADRDWIRERLMEDHVGSMVFARYRTHSTKAGLWARGERGLDEPRTCSSIAACCTIGYVELASLCATDVEPEFADRNVWDAAIERLTATLLELGWAEPVIRQWWEDNVDVEESPSYEEWRAGVTPLSATEIGEDGLVALWNDQACQGREQALELIERAAG